MTRDEILALKPGRELDALVMRTVFKAEKKDIGDECYWVSEVNGEEVCWPRWFSPSTDIAAAWEVWEHGIPDNWRLTITKANGKYLALIIGVNREKGHRTVAQVEADTAEEAMSKCRLLAVMEG